MRDYLFLINLLESYSFKIRRQHCNGCQNSHGSQREHEVCMTDCQKFYYFELALDLMKIENVLTVEEYEFLKDNIPYIFTF
jgi:hypothetical protein